MPLLSKEIKASLSSSSFNPLYWKSFKGIADLYGIETLAKFAISEVLVIGLGGVGSWAVESLARTGIGKLILLDNDDICLSNINRQLPALYSSKGIDKGEALLYRCLDINPAAQVCYRPAFLTPDNLQELIQPLSSQEKEEIAQLQEELYPQAGQGKEDKSSDLAKSAETTESVETVVELDQKHQELFAELASFLKQDETLVTDSQDSKDSQEKQKNKDSQEKEDNQESKDRENNKESKDFSFYENLDKQAIFNINDPAGLALSQMQGELFVIDAIDDSNTKTALIDYCRRHKIKLVVCGGAGGKVDPGKITLADLTQTINDPMLAKIRYNLRKNYGYKERFKDKKFNLPVVFSTEVMKKPSGACDLKGLSCANGYGSAQVVTATMGNFAVSKILDFISKS